MSVEALPQNYFHMNLENEVFSIRDGEKLFLWDGPPHHYGKRFIAVMARSVEMPEGPKASVRASDGAPIESAAILAAEFQHQNQCWQWLQLSPCSKEHIVDMMFNNHCELDRWYYLSFEELEQDGQG